MTSRRFFAAKNWERPSARNPKEAENKMCFERFHFGVVGACVLAGFLTGYLFFDADAAVGGALAGATIGMIVAASLLKTE
ncbi:hypothetical protein [Burkholderia diffusa]|uniref:hypothetical protein n=1 Tax=Burkholderia diffusa TaxID=488732 RepID=UPI0012DA40A5|nr:hypothetical protein [Burkholderia diffusa]